MAEHAWRTLFQDLLRQVHGQCDGLVGVLALSQETLSRMQIGTAGDLLQVHVLQYNVEMASTSFSESISLMGLAETLALRGCADDPSAPLPSCHAIARDHHHAIRLAMASLQDAKVHAEAALRHTVKASSRMWAIPFIVYQFLHFPAANDFVEFQIHAAIKDFQKALECAQWAVPLLAAAVTATTSGANS
uniref:Uncharacterized protein n=1 Tax=Oryza brachyantha TaxID=4533 RepID=J3KWK6_ORYBR